MNKEFTYIMCVLMAACSFIEGASTNTRSIKNFHHLHHIDTVGELKEEFENYFVNILPNNKKKHSKLSIFNVFNTSYVSMNSEELFRHLILWEKTQRKWFMEDMEKKSKEIFQGQLQTYRTYRDVILKEFRFCEKEQEGYFTKNISLRYLRFNIVHTVNKFPYDTFAMLANMINRLARYHQEGQCIKYKMAGYRTDYYCLHGEFYCENPRHEMIFEGDTTCSICKGDFLFIMNYILQELGMNKSLQEFPLVAHYKEKGFLQKLHCGRFNTLILATCFKKYLVALGDLSEGRIKSFKLPNGTNFTELCQNNGINFLYLLKKVLC